MIVFKRHPRFLIFLKVLQLLFSIVILTLELAQLFHYKNNFPGQPDDWFGKANNDTDTNGQIKIWLLFLCSLTILTSAIYFVMFPRIWKNGSSVLVEFLYTFLWLATSLAVLDPEYVGSEWLHCQAKSIGFAPNIKTLCNLWVTSIIFTWFNFGLFFITSLFSWELKTEILYQYYKKNYKISWIFFYNNCCDKNDKNNANCHSNICDGDEENNNGSGEETSRNNRGGLNLPNTASHYSNSSTIQEIDLNNKYIYENKGGLDNESDTNNSNTNINNDNILDINFNNSSSNSNTNNSSNNSNTNNSSNNSDNNEEDEISGSFKGHHDISFSLQELQHEPPTTNISTSTSTSTSSDISNNNIIIIKENNLDHNTTTTNISISSQDENVGSFLNLPKKQHDNSSLQEVPL